MNFGGEWREFKVPGQNTLLQLVPILTLDRKEHLSPKPAAKIDEVATASSASASAAAAASTSAISPDDDAYTDADVDRMSTKDFREY